LVAADESGESIGAQESETEYGCRLAGTRRSLREDDASIPSLVAETTSSYGRSWTRQLLEHECHRCVEILDRSSFEPSSYLTWEYSAGLRVSVVANRSGLASSDPASLGPVRLAQCSVVARMTVRLFFVVVTLDQRREHSRVNCRRGAIVFLSAGWRQTPARDLDRRHMIASHRQEREVSSLRPTRSLGVRQLRSFSPAAILPCIDREGDTSYITASRLRAGTDRAVGIYRSHMIERLPDVSACCSALACPPSSSIRVN
jgi:hypothetical protein